MAVINTADDKLTHPQAPGEVTGARLMSVCKAIVIAAGDDDTSKWLIAEVPDTAVIEEITMEGAAITGGTSYHLGLHDENGNIIGTGDQFMSAVDLSSTSGLPTGPFGDPVRQMMTALDYQALHKKVYEIAGHVNKPFPASGETLKRSKYRIVLIGNTAGGAGTLIFRVRYRMAV